MDGTFHLFAGNVVELRCSYDPDSMRGGANAGKKVKGTIHWLSAPHAIPAEVRLYDRLFATPDPEHFDEGGSYLDNLNPNSKEVLTGSFVEPSVAGADAMAHFQFERQGYFITDEKDSRPDKLVFNRVVTLRDSWAKINKSKPSGNGANKKAKKQQQEVVTRTREDFVAALKEQGADAVASFEKYVDDWGLSLTEAEVLAVDTGMSRLADEAVTAGASGKSAAAWVVSVLSGELKDASLEDLKFDGAGLAALIALVDDGTISNRTAKEVLAEMIKTGASAGDIVEEKGLKEVSDTDALSAIVEELIGKFPDKVEAYRSGKTGLMGFFVGQAMKATKGQANPKVLTELLKGKL